MYSFLCRKTQKCQQEPCLPPNQLSFDVLKKQKITPISIKGSASGVTTPFSAGSPPDCSPMSSASNSSSLTPTMTGMTLGRCRGIPHKELKEPTFDDFPVDGTPLEKQHWFKAEQSEQWWYQKLTSDDFAAYCQAEKQC